MATRFTPALTAFLALATATQAQPQTKPANKAPNPAPAAKSPTGQPPAKNSPPKGAGTPVEFAEIPLRINSVGLTVHLPTGSIAQTSGSTDQVSAQIIAADSTWLINIQTPQSKNLQTDPDAVATEVLNQLLASVGVPERKVVNGRIVETIASTRATIVEPIKPLIITASNPQEPKKASRFYVRIPRGDGEPAVIRGYTVFQTGPGRFVTFDLTTPETAFAAARPVYETIIAKAQFEDAAAMAAARGVAVQAGIEFVNRLTPSDYEAACAVLQDQWYRLAKPAPGGADADAEEIAYRRIRAHKGFRGEIDPMRPESKWGAADRQQGYVVRIDARFIQSPLVVDSVGVYFMSLDRREEAWSLKTVIRDPSARKPTTWEEVGGRVGGDLKVTTAGSQESKAARPTVPDIGYLNQVEGFLLPQLLVRNQKADAKGRAGDYGFYSYQSEFGNVRLRRDTLAEPQDRAGAWILTTRMNEDRDPQVSIYNERGELIKTTLPNNTIWTPSSLQRLAEIWQGKGLPMD